MFKLLDGRSHFYQWDLDRKLIVEDASITEVHFCNRTDDCSLICEVYDLNGLRVANVPNILLQDNWCINVYAYDGHYTKHSEKFDVVKRSKPADYVYTETEIKNYDELLERLEQIEENGISDEAVESAIEKYLEENDIRVDLTGYATETYVQEQIEAIEFPETDLSDYATKEYVDKEIDAIPDVDLTGYATEEYVGKKIAEAQMSGSDVDLSNYYTKSETNAAIAANLKDYAKKTDIPSTSGLATEQYVREQIETIELLPGEKGDKGDPGYTPVKGVDYFDGKDGYTPVKGVDYFDGEPGADYVLTAADKEEIAGMVEVSGDLTDYYTKEEIDELLANLPSGGGDLPSSEEVGW